MTEQDKFRVCAEVDHGGDRRAIQIYEGHRSRPDQYSSGWLMYFSDQEVRELSDLVEEFLKRETIILPMMDIDALSVRAVSIYTYIGTPVLDQMCGASSVRIQLVDPK